MRPLSALCLVFGLGLWTLLVFHRGPSGDKCVSSAYENDDGFGNHVQTMFQVYGESMARQVPYCLRFPFKMAHTNASRALYNLTGFEFLPSTSTKCDRCRWQYLRDFGMKIPASDFFTAPMLRRIQQTYRGLPHQPKMFAAPNRTHVVLHFRVRNAHDVRNQYWDFQLLRRIMDDVRERYPRPLFHVVTQTPGQGPNVWRRLLYSCLDCVLELDGDVVETYDAMVKAPVLVIAGSAFSYTAAWFNRNDVYYVSYHQGPLPSWRLVEARRR